MKRLLALFLLAICARAATVSVTLFTMRQNGQSVTVSVSVDNVTLVISSVTIVSNAVGSTCIATLTDTSIPRTVSVTSSGSQTRSFSIPTAQRTIKLANLQGDLADPFEAHASCTW